MTSTPESVLAGTPVSLLSVAPVVPVVVIDDVDHAVPLARALVAGGLFISLSAWSVGRSEP